MTVYRREWELSLRKYATVVAVHDKVVTLGWNYPNKMRCALDSEKAEYEELILRRECVLGPYKSFRCTSGQPSGFGEGTLCTKCGWGWVSDYTNACTTFQFPFAALRPAVSTLDENGRPRKRIVTADDFPMDIEDTYSIEEYQNVKEQFELGL